MLEALVVIFRDLDLEEETEFNYEIEYQCKNNLLKVEGGKNTKGKFQFYKGVKLKGSTAYNVKPISKTLIKKNKSDYLPKYVFSYYSGVSNRLLEHFDKHQKRFYDELIKGIDAPPRPLFYARQIHSYFVLMAFYAFSDEKASKFLKKFLGIVGLESVLFVLKKPVWAKSKTEALDFWKAKGVVREFLDELFKSAMAPIVHEDTVREDFRRSHKQEQLYLYISNQEKLEKIASKYLTNAEFFKSLESTYISDLIQEVRVKVKKENIHGDITFKELSEGEQQLLTVIGLLRFTKEEESLILLDEPDTHLNPLWKWKYMNLLEEYSGKEETSQILMTTHDPLVIGGLTKEEIRIFQSVKKIDEDGEEYQQVETFEPDFDPKGLGVAGILRSPLFNLPSDMDEESFNALSRKRELEVLERDNKLNEEQKEELQNLTYRLSKIGFDKVQRDPLYDKFVKAVYENEDLQKPAISLEERRIQEGKMAKLIKELMDEEETNS